MMSTADDGKLFSLLDALDQLKHLKRTGWLLVGISEPETVASHMYRMAVLAMTLSAHRKELDVQRCVRMALVHDIGEALIGDITPYCGVSDEEKFRREQKAVKEIASWVPPQIGAEWCELWHEYEAAVTAEAKAVKQLDKLDMIAQALAYEQKHSVDLSEFFATTMSAFPDEPFAGWAAQIRQKRTERKAEKK